MDEHREEREELEAIQRDDEDDAREQERDAFANGETAYDPNVGYDSGWREWR